MAMEKFGAEWGVGVGRTGQTYAIPTMHGGVDVIKPYVDEFVEFAINHREYTFLVTKIGCGIAGFAIEEIAPLFADAVDVENIILPKEFESVIHGMAGCPTSCSWDSSEDFLVKYTPLMQSIKDGCIIQYSEIKQLRKKVFQNTVSLVNQGFYHTETNEKIYFNAPDSIVSGTAFYSQEMIVDLPEQPSGTTTIVEVVNADCLEEGVRLLEQGYNPAILNMASRQNPGGGVINGAGAQEETIFRRTSLFKSLYQFAPYAAQYGVKKSKYQYPMDRNFGGIYSPGITIFRESEANGYKLMSHPKEMAFISVAGINKPELNPEGMIVDTLVETVKNKIRTIFRIGLIHGHDSLVLGALGCGAFCNPPRHIAKLFHEVMNEPEFKNAYRLITFAILEDHNSHKGHNKEGNYLPFKEEFLQAL